ncbi:MAG: DUF11 domain-containing protein [Planctomycetes bacterium]|nr:DUF11 domain-containing protein [Planctomycetota bacterium]
MRTSMTSSDRSWFSSLLAAVPVTAMKRAAAAVAFVAVGLLGAVAAEAGDPVRLLIEVPPDVTSLDCGETVDLQIVGEDASRTRVGFSGRNVEVSATQGTVEIVQQPYRFRFRAPATLPDVTNVRIRAWLKEAPEIVGETTVRVVPPAPFRRLVLQGAGSTPAGASVDLLLRGETATGALADVPDGAVTLTVTGPGRVTLLRTSRYRFETDMNASGTARIVASLNRYPSVTGTMDILVTGGSGGSLPLPPVVPPSAGGPPPAQTVTALLIEVAAAPNPIKVGDTTTYFVSVTNAGNTDERNVVVTATVPAEQTLRSIDTSRAQSVAYTMNGNVIRFAPVATLARGSQIRYSIAAAASTENADARFTADVVSDAQRSPIAKIETVHQSPAGRRPGGNRPDAVSSLRLEAVGSPSPVDVGSQSTYTISVTNQGTARETNLVVTATLPANQRYVSSDATGADGAAAALNGQVVRFAPVALLAPGQRLTYRVVAAATSAGDAQCSFTVASDLQRSPITQLATVVQVGGTDLSSTDNNADAVVWTSGAVRLETWRLRDDATQAWTPIDRKLPPRGTELVANRNIQKIRVGVIARNVAKVEVEEWSGDRGSIVTQLPATKDGRFVLVERKDGMRVVHYEVAMPEGPRSLSMAIIVTTTDGRVTRDEFTFRRGPAK